MVDFKNISKPKNKLGTPPKADEIKGNLEAPEVAPANPSPAKPKKGKVGRPATNRTEQLTMALTPELKKKLKTASFMEERAIGDIVDEAFAFYEKKK